MSSAAKTRKWYHYVGPGLITACVVIGPGSILTSSKTGAANGFAMSWIVLVAVFFMSVYTSMGAKLGVIASESAGKLVTDRVGRWLAALIGLGVFFISAAFQFGNNLGVHSAFKAFVDFDYFVIFFNALALAFLFGFKNLYKAVERLMMVFVGLMLVSFAINLGFARPNVGEAISGFVPSNFANIDISVLALIGTTFVVTAAYYQSYLVRQKGWGKAELTNGLVDARVSATIMGLITIMIMWTAASVLQGKTLGSVSDVAQQLEPLFGVNGKVIFCIGLFSAAFSSFLVNSMIGGFILADGLGIGNRPTDLGPKVATALVLLTGMCVSLVVILFGWNPVPAIIAAQAVTVIASPLIAGALWWLTNRKDIMGDDRNGPTLNVLAGIGFVLLLGMAWRTAFHAIPSNIDKWKKSAAAQKEPQDGQNKEQSGKAEEKGK